MSTNYHKTTYDYSGRTVDLLLLQFVKDAVADKLVRPDVSKVPRITAGIEKLVQRYALLFLTTVNTVKNMESEGTGFMSSLGSGEIYDDNTLKAAAAVANDSVSMQIKSEDKTLETPPDESLDVAEVVETSLDRKTATVYVTVKITSSAGETYKYTTPLTTGV